MTGQKRTAKTPVAHFTKTPASDRRDANHTEMSTKAAKTGNKELDQSLSCELPRPTSTVFGDVEL